MHSVIVWLVSGAVMGVRGVIGRVRGAMGRLRRFWLVRQILSVVNSLQFINYFGQTLFLTGIISIAAFGINTALPHFYVDTTLTVLTTFGYFCCVQIMINWLCLKFVSSKYIPFKHGGMPQNIQIGQKVCASICYDTPYGYDSGIQNGNHVNRKDATTVYVATGISDENRNEPKRTAFPYFSWTPCLQCNRPRPPRCHHCPLCDQCVLKRDHHCFIVGACVGYRNQRHFVVFLFWCAVGTIYALIMEVPYAHEMIGSHVSLMDALFPIALVRAILGYISWYSAGLIVLCTLDFGFVLWSSVFLVAHFYTILQGKTAFEDEHKLNVVDTRNASQKIASVFGPLWLLNFLFPLHFIYDPIEDPIKWFYIRS